MLPFVILLVVPIFIQHAKIKGINYDKRCKFAITFFFVFLTALVALRHITVGTDTELYTYYFERFSVTDWANISELSLELGYSYLNKIISVFTKEPQVFLAIAAIAVSAMIYPTYRRVSTDPSLTIVLFCTMSTFVMMFSGVRQMMAIAIGFIAYEFARRKKLIFFIIAVLLATTFHSSAFMLIFMYPMYHAKITKKWLYFIVPLLVTMFVFNKQIFAVLGTVLERYTRFSVDEASTGAYTMILLFAIFAVFAFLVPDEKSLDKETIGLRNFLLLSLFIQIFAPLHTLAMRMNYYYIVFIPLLLPKIIEHKSERWRQVAIVARHVMVVFFFLYSFVSLSQGALDVYPYHFFWEGL